ncbi:unnamed protein product [Brassica rapa subsp. trilocularis]
MFFARKLCASTDLQKQREKVVRRRKEMNGQENADKGWGSCGDDVDKWQVVIVLKEWHDAFDMPNLAL